MLLNRQSMEGAAWARALEGAEGIRGLSLASVPQSGRRGDGRVERRRRPATARVACRGGRAGRDGAPGGRPLPPSCLEQRGGRSQPSTRCFVSSKAAVGVEEDQDRRATESARGAGSSGEQGSSPSLGDLRDDIQRLRGLLLCLRGQDAESQIAILKKDPAVRAAPALEIARRVGSLPLLQQVIVYSILALRQSHVLQTGGDKHTAEFVIFLQKLELVQQFYDSIGGIIGYQLKVLELVVGETLQEEEKGAREEGAAAGDSHGRQHQPQDGAGAAAEASSSSSSSSSAGLSEEEEAILFPNGHNISENNATTRNFVCEGLRAIPELGEVYPVGGAGDRLGLIDKTTGQPLPTAMLPYCGRSLLENLVRDVQARENLYYRVFGKQHCTPIAIMTSDAKGNHEHITQICEEKGWFGRKKDSFFLFKQPLVPVVNGSSGQWLVTGHFEILMKPSGHGAIWKLMYDKEVLQWFGKHGRRAALVRQISNPMASTDTTMIALAGKGHSGRHVFGFASCERKVGAAEGCNVTKQYYDREAKANKYAITCVEYTEFEKYGLKDSGEVNAEGEEVSRFPANTNIL